MGVDHKHLKGKEAASYKAGGMLTFHEERVLEAGQTTVDTRGPSVCVVLETLIDRTSLLDVLTGLECVCSEKAAIMRANGEHAITARRWESAAKKIRAVAEPLTI